MKYAVAVIVWVLILIAAWVSNPWGIDPSGDADTTSHDINFHMHDPLHEGGKVSMSGQFHVELLCRPSGRHSLWISNAFRQELDPAGFIGDITVDRKGGNSERAMFRRVGRSFQLEANTAPISDQAWVTVNGQLGTITEFKRMRFFWDYRTALKVPKGLDSMVPIPMSNPLTPAKIRLGHDLFYEPNLSRDGTISCASCHKKEYAFADNLPVSKGVKDQLGKRNTPTVLNAAYHKSLFWDGRSDSLEDQAQRPILDHAEMGIDNESMLVARLEQKYAERFKQVLNKPISLQSIAMALASYERSLFSGDSDFDRYEAGNRDAMLPSAIRGRALFFGKGKCGHCHIPPMFTDYEFHNLGIGWDGSKFKDPGRFEVTNHERHIGQFKTPSLRDVTRTGPYMHDGSFGDLLSVVEFYNQGGRSNPMMDTEIKPLGLTEKQMTDLVAFLTALEGRWTTYNGEKETDNATVSGRKAGDGK